MLFSLCACATEPHDAPDQTEGEGFTSEQITAEETEAIPEGAFLLYDGEAFVPFLIRPEKVDSDTLALAVALRKKLDELIPGDAMLSIKDDYLKKDQQPAEFEMLIGNLKSHGFYYVKCSSCNRSSS